MLTNVAKDNYNEARELRSLFEKQLRELYWAEQKMLGAFSSVTGSVFSKDLVTVLHKDRANTISHITRLEKIFDAIGLEAEMLPYEALQCLYKEADSLVQHTRNGVVRDAGLIAILQKIKHYEIACYGTMRAYAIALREEDVVILLEETLNEEKNTDTELSAIAESHINTEAADKEI
jgi:ferritin-like metal-binding protein YciE